MRHRSIAFAAAALLAVSFGASCMRRPTPPPTTGPVSGLPKGEGMDCGTITNGRASKTDALSCINNYHLDIATRQKRFITLVKGGTTLLWQEDTHTFKASWTDGGAVQSANCGILQMSVSANGTIGSLIPGTPLNCAIPAQFKTLGGGGITYPTLPGRTTTTMGSMPGMPGMDHSH